MKVIKAILIFFGILFLIEVIAILCFVIFDPLNLKPMLFPESKNLNGTKSDVTTSAQGGDHPLLTEDQEKTLKTFGINPANLPTEITPQMQSCFEAKLGSGRMNEIKQGSEPSIADFFKARDCL